MRTRLAVIYRFDNTCSRPNRQLRKPLIQVTIPPTTLGIALLSGHSAIYRFFGREGHETNRLEALMGVQQQNQPHAVEP
jgi:hypothetical protein